MDINLLAINVGNSRMAIGVFLGGTLEYSTRLPHDRRADWPGVIADAWKQLEGADGVAVAGASVNPPLVEAIEHVVQQASGEEIEWVGRQLELPMKVGTDSPAETGIDRVLNVAAAYEQIGRACVVVDAGTALTVDVCDDAGTFLGGAIAPGAGMMLDALHEHTAKLPRVQLAAPSGAIGASTQQAILQGVYTGIRGAVKELVESYATHLGRWPEVLATGGDAQTLFADWELVHAVSPELTLYGIALAYTNHHIKHGT
jgi:type III pantothenate kinase